MKTNSTAPQWVKTSLFGLFAVVALVLVAAVFRGMAAAAAAMALRHEGAKKKRCR